MRRAFYMDAQAAKALFWQAKYQSGRHMAAQGQPELQEVIDQTAWDVVIAAIRKDSERELERLRARNRDLEAIVAQCMADANERCSA